ncbi:MAG: phosphoribosylanthranilate isomerase [Coriobacteriia bacterium]|nr:phosphoribosylanthranilate isomerase [Coriobacteriia bacterium]MBN2847025.1 phosphoribosylanthranilate isomerase [Coriobacteriia bacterium]
MRRTRIKICGLTRPEDAAAAVAAGADALGVILAPSKRRVTFDQAAAVFAGVPPLVARVGVFVDAHADDVWEAVARLGLTAVQFHGDEAPEMCEAAPVPVIKALRVGPGFDPSVAERYRGVVSALLLDTLVAGEKGGTGKAFGWHDVAGRLPAWAPVLLAGGLGPDNVAEAIGVLRPFAVDVSSGVEQAPGVKDHRLIERFVSAVHTADEPAPMPDDRF